MRVWWTAATFLAALMAGCTDSGGNAGAAATDGTPEGDLATLPLELVPDQDGGVMLSREPMKEDAMPEPMPWAVGDWFGVHVFLGNDDNEGIHFNCIVVQADDSKYFLASDKPEAAKEDATWDYPILGTFSASDLSTTGLGGPWELYKFPLKDGDTWKATVTVDLEFPVELDFQATFNPSITTQSGKKAGWDIVASTPEGVPLLAYDYVPEVGWFTKFYVYDTSTPELDDYFIKATSMGYGDGWKGTYYVDTAQQLIGFDDIGYVFVDPENPGPDGIGPNPHVPFTVPAGANYVYGFLFSGAWMGASSVQLVDPENQARYTQEGLAHDYSMQGTEVGIEIDEAALAGEWRLVMGGAGAVSYGGGIIWAVTETTGTL